VAGVGGASSTLSLDYPADPGIDQASQDVAALAEAGQWTIAAPSRAALGAAVLYETQITPALTLDPEGQVPLFPFLSVFRRFPEITFVFVGESAGAPGDFHDENRFVRARWTRSGSTATYELHVKDPSFKSPADVALVDRPADQPLPPSAPVGGPTRVAPAALWALLLVGAAGLGVFVGGLTWWLLTVVAQRKGWVKEVKAEPEAKQASPGPEAASDMDPSLGTIDIDPSAE
jgi:hypothetical protein